MDNNFDAFDFDVETNHVKTSARFDDVRSRPMTGDSASPGKIFIGGLARETTTAQFVKYFSKYGELTDSVIMKDRQSGHPRGFGFVTYADASVVDRVIEETHIINGKQVEIKRTIPKGASGSKDFKTKKIFVGGIPTSMTDDELKDFFSKFGEVKDHQIMRDHSSSRSRGFGFVTFDEENTVDSLMSGGNKLDMAGTQVEIKKAEPKKSNPPPHPQHHRYSDSRPSFGSGYNDGYGSYGAGFAPGPYRSGGAFGGRMGPYGDGYGEFGGYGGGYNGAGMGPFRGGGESSLGYSGRYGGAGDGGFGRNYDLGRGYGGPGAGYEGYGGPRGNGGSMDGAGYGGSYDGGFGGNYGGPQYYGSGRGGGSGGMGGSGRYHPYGR